MPRPRGQTVLDHEFFRAINTEQKAYWLGFLMADGCIHEPKRGARQLSVHLATKDLHHLERFREAIGAATRITPDQGARSAVFRVSSDAVCESLISHGCTPRKSLTLRFPTLEAIFEGPFVRGYFDGDGSACVCRNTLFVQFCGTHDFLLGVARVLGTERRPVLRGRHSNLALNGRADVTRAFDIMYRESTVHLDRKREVFEAGINRAEGGGECVSCQAPFTFSVGRGTANRRYCSKRCRDKAFRMAKRSNFKPEVA